MLPLIKVLEGIKNTTEEVLFQDKSTRFKNFLAENKQEVSPDVELESRQMSHDIGKYLIQVKITIIHKTFPLKWRFVFLFEFLLRTHFFTSLQLQVSLTNSVSPRLQFKQQVSTNNPNFHGAEGKTERSQERPSARLWCCSMPCERQRPYPVCRQLSASLGPFWKHFFEALPQSLGAKAD